MSRGLTDPIEPEQPNAPTVQQLDEAMKTAYENIYELAIRVEQLEKLLANLIAPEPETKPTKKKHFKGL